MLSIGTRYWDMRRRLLERNVWCAQNMNQQQDASEIKCAQEAVSNGVSVETLKTVPTAFIPRERLQARSPTFDAGPQRKVFKGELQWLTAV